MQYYVIRRLLLLIPVVVVVTLVIFFVMRIVPGDITTLIMQEGGSAEQAARLRRELGLDQPLHSQYLQWLWGVLRLDLGTSLWTSRPIVEELALRIPVSVELALLSTLLALGLAIPLGVVSAVKQDTWVDYALRLFSIGGLSMPNFWIGLLLILFLALVVRWLPEYGYRSLWEDPWTNLQQFIWPSLAMGYRYAAVLMRMTRSQMLETLRQDFVRTARAKGLLESVVLYRHTLKNAILPVLTLAGIQFATILGGLVIIESLFALPGVGRAVVQAVSTRDYPMIQAVILLIVTVFMLVNLLVDLLYAWLDPRIRYT